MTRGISVIMPAYNAAHYMPRVLPPLLAMRDAGEVLEVLVVDDRSTDDTAEIARKLGATILTTPKNGGPGAARNFAATKAKGDILWLVDSDVIAHPGGPAQITAAFADPDVHAVFGSYDDAPDDPGWMSQYKNLMHRYYHQRANREARTFWAGCGALRKDALLAVGGFDVATYTRPSIEDIELGYRITAAGGRIRVLPELLGKHLKTWTLRGAMHTDIFCRALPWSRLMISREGLGEDLNTSRAERAKAGLAGLLALALLLCLAAPQLWWITALLALAVAAANAPLTRFLARAAGWRVAILGTLYHQVYYLYSATVFVWCILENRFWPHRRPQTV